MEKNNTSMFSCTDDMKRSPSQLALEELLKHTSVQDFNNCNQKDDHKVFGGNNGDTNGAFGFENGGRRFDDHVSYPIRNQDMTNGFPSCGAATDKALWSQNLTPKNSSITVTIDSQSSICVGSPTSATKPKSRDNNQATSGSSHNPSDDDDIETEAGPCEQSTDPSHPTDIKRIKRMVSNRESARRSRRRKQAHLADLEQQVEQLRGENASLFKQLADATQQFKDATTNNRVLKSDVEALRAKVKLAEDLVTRGTLTSNLSHLLQNYLNTPQSTNNNNMSPTIAVRGDDNTFPGVSLSGQGSAFGLENIDSFIGSIKNGGVISDSVSCVSDIWPWESHVAPVSK